MYCSNYCYSYCSTTNAFVSCSCPISLCLFLFGGQKKGNVVNTRSAAIKCNSYRFACHRFCSISFCRRGERHSKASIRPSFPSLLCSSFLLSLSACASYPFPSLWSDFVCPYRVSHLYDPSKRAGKEKKGKTKSKKKTNKQRLKWMQLPIVFRFVPSLWRD